METFIDEESLFFIVRIKELVSIISGGTEIALKEVSLAARAEIRGDWEEVDGLGAKVVKELGVMYNKVSLIS